MPRRNRGAYLKYIKARGIYYIQWSDQGRTIKRSTGTSDRAEAEDALATFIRDKREAEQVDGPRHPRQFPIEEALDFYGRKRAPQTASPERIGYAIEALMGFWHYKSVGDINEASCIAYATWRKRAPGTIRRELGVLRAAVTFAHRHGKVTTAPFLWLPPKPEGKNRWLTRGEAARLLNAARKSRADSRLYLPLFVVLALYTGARKEAILSLQWRQVDLDRDLIDFNPPGRARTKKGRAVIPIPRPLRTLLMLARQRGSEFGFVVHRDGQRLRDVKKGFARICRDAQLDDVTPHTLRHTCGTWMAQNGGDLFAIGRWLGHSSARTTELYAHHHPDYLASALQAMERRA